MEPVFEQLNAFIEGRSDLLLDERPTLHEAAAQITQELPSALYDEIAGSGVLALVKERLKASWTRKVEVASAIRVGQQVLPEIDLPQVITVPESDDVRYVHLSKASFDDLLGHFSLVDLNARRVNRRRDGLEFVIQNIRPFAAQHPGLAVPELINLWQAALAA